MRVMGIDPGIAIVGFAILDYKESQLTAVDYGSIQTKVDTLTPRRLMEIYEATRHLLRTYQPNVLAMERLFFNRNVTTAFTVGQACGVMMLAAQEAKIPVREYTPIQVKMAVAGYGKAEKKQIQEMVKILLHLPEIPKPDDVADAIAIAICQAHTGMACTTS